MFVSSKSSGNIVLYKLKKLLDSLVLFALGSSLRLWFKYMGLTIIWQEKPEVDVRFTPLFVRVE